MKKFSLILCTTLTLVFGQINKAQAGTIMMVGGALTTTLTLLYGNDNEAVAPALAGLTTGLVGIMPLVVGGGLFARGHKRAGIILMVLDEATYSSNDYLSNERLGLYQGLIQLGESDSNASYIAETAERFELENGLVEYTHADIDEEKLKMILEELK